MLARAGFPGRMGPVSGPAFFRSPSYLLNGVAPTLIHDYSAQKYYNSAIGVHSFPFTSTRTTNATMFNSAGNLSWAPANLIPNSMMVGAGIGVVPTGWTISAPVTGITPAIVGTGVEDGMPYIDMRWSGTNSGATTYPTLNFTPSGSITARVTEEYTASVFIKLIAGDFGPGVQAAFQLFEGNPGYLAGTAVGLRASGVNSNKYTRLAISRTLNNASTTSIQAHVQFTVNNADTIDLTIRIAAPQIERKSINSPLPFNPTTTTAYYGPRFDYDPTTLLPMGLLVEGAATNLSVDSFPTAADYTTAFATMTDAGTICGQPAATFTTTASSGSFVYVSANASAPAASTTYVSSVLVKRGNHPRVQFAVSNNHGLTAPGSDFAWVNYNFDTQTVTALGSGAPTAVATPTGDGVRLELRYTSGNAPTSGANGIILCVDSDSATRLSATTTIGATVIVTGYQFETGTFATSLIPTYGVTATRAADTVSMSTGAWLTQGSGTILVESKIPDVGVGIFPSLLRIDNGTAADRLQVFGFTAASNFTVGARIDDTSAVQVNTGTVNSINWLALDKFALAYSTNNTRMVSNNGTVALDALCTIPITFNTLRVGSTTSGTSHRRWISEVRYYPSTSASDAQLQALTV